MKNTNMLILLGAAALALYLLKDKIAAALGYGAAFIPGPLDKYDTITTPLGTDITTSIRTVQKLTVNGLALQGQGAYRMNEIEKIAKAMNPEYATSPNPTGPALAFTQPKMAWLIPQVA